MAGPVATANCRTVAFRLEVVGNPVSVNVVTDVIAGATPGHRNTAGADETVTEPIAAAGIPATCTVWAGLDDDVRVTVNPVQVCVSVQLVVAAGTNDADVTDAGPVPFTFVAETVHVYV